MNKILIIIILLLISTILVIKSEAGASFTALSDSIVIYEMDKINEKLIEARKASQRGLSKERIKEIKDKADDVLYDGAMFQCTSYVVN